MTNTEIIELSKLVLALITEGVKLLSDAHGGKISASEALDRINKLHNELEVVNATIDRAVDEKFGK